MSYVHFNDKHDNDRISALARRLADEVQAQTGKEFSVFQDRTSIRWGEGWRERIGESLDSVTFLIPIVTPGYFNSEACRDELERFVQRERELQRNDLILPAIYIEVDQLSDEKAIAADAAMSAIAAHQYRDWTDLRFGSLRSAKVSRKLAELAREIKARLEQEPVGPVRPRERRPLEAETSSRVKHFSADDEQRYNLAFYDYFCERIERARHDIYITGEGFDYSTREGRSLAERFTHSFEQALDAGVTVVRVQTRSQAHEQWGKALADLVERYSDTFDLYVLRDRHVAQMSSVCVIDPELATENVVEIMLSTQRLFGVKAADLAGTAVFIEGNQALAVDLRRRIISLTSRQVAHHPVSRQEAEVVLLGEAG